MPNSGANTGGTSWAAGLQAVANDMATHKYQVVYFITDGQPTFGLDGQSNRAGNSTERSEIDQALQQKARIEQRGGAVIPVGVGTNMENNAIIEVYEPYRLIWIELWRVAYETRHQQLLRDMTTSGKTPIIAPSYSTLQSQLFANFATGCVQVVKEIVDANGTVLQNGSGWTFDLSFEGLPGTAAPPSQVVTGANGIAEFSLGGFGSGSPRVTIQERQQDGYRLMPTANRNAQCFAYKVGAPRRAVSVTNVGALGVRVPLNATEIIACTFRNLASVPLKLTKTVNSNSTILQEELNSRRYSFSYDCRIGQEVIASGRVEDVAGGAEVQVGNTRIPVGAKCTIREDQPEVAADRYSLETTWSAVNGTVSSRGPGLETVVTVGSGGFTSGAGTTVQVTNSYETASATITVRKQVTGDIPLASAPDTFQVQYSCRYVPDIGNPPELDPDAPDPYFVGNGYVLVPRDGTPVTIPVADTAGRPIPGGEPRLFPVGTQCELSEPGSATSPITVPQFDLATTWQSDVCLSSGAGAGDLSQCNSNYIYVDSADEHNVTVVNTYTRQLGSVVVNKAVDGDAASRGNEFQYPFVLRCENDFTREFTVSAGGNYRVDNVPVGIECTVTETPLESGSSDINVTLPAPQTVTLQSRDEVANVTMTNTLNYKRGSAVLTKDVVIDETITDPAVELYLLTTNFPITGVCELPDGTSQDINGSVLAGSSLEVNNLPVGTSCRFIEQNLDDLPEGVELVTPGSVTITVTAEGNNTGTLVNTFQAARGELIITKDVNITYLRTSDLDSFIPQQFDISYSCIGGPAGSVSLAAGDQKIIEDVPAGAPCVVSENLVDAPEVERTTEFRGVSGTQSGDEFSFNFPTGGSGATVVVNNQYRPARHEITLIKETALVDANDEVITEGWVDEVINPDRTYPISYTCTRQSAPGTVFPTYTENIRAGVKTTIQVPVGTDCVIAEDSQPIPNTSGPVATYSLNGAGAVEGGITVAVGDTEAPLDVDILNTYQMQYGSFSLKKKVDGEGVATIPSSKDFKFSYRCVLGTNEIKQGGLNIGRFDDAADFTVDGVPLGSDCVVTEDLESADELNADLDNRWTVADSSSGWGAQEDACGTGAGITCSTDVENSPHQATFRIVAKGERPSGDPGEATLLPANFQGTYVLWNTYTYWKNMLEVTKRVTGDGADLATGDTFTFQLVCTDPNYADSGLGDLPFIQDPTITQRISITGDGFATAPTPVPVGYDCTITESQVGGYDAVVSATFDGDGFIGEDTTHDPTVIEGATEGFTVVAGDLSGEGYVNAEPQRITVVNNYERPRAELAVAKQLAGSDNVGSVNAYITEPERFTMNWVCTDQFIENTSYSGTVVVTPGAEPTPLTLADGTLIPQSALCSVSEVIDSKIPAGFEDVVNSAHEVHVTRDDQTVFQRANVVTTDEFGLGAEATTVEFTNSYWVNQTYLGLDKYIEGDPDGSIFPPAAEGGEGGVAFNFNFRCEVTNLLPGQPVPAISNGIPLTGETGPDGGVIVEGSFTLGHGQQWATGALPMGSSCEVSEQAFSAEVQQILDDNNLQMQPNYVYPAENPDLIEPEPVDPEDPDTVPQPVIGDAPRLQLREGAVIPLGGEAGSYAWLLNSLYRADGEVQVQKVSYPDDQPLSGARFAIYEVDPNAADSLGEVVAEELQHISDGDNTRFTVNLRPGSYFLVETRSGTGSELLPAPWRFDVEPTNAGELGDLEFNLSAYAQNSGLIEVQEPGEDPVTPWIIKVANVESGELPMTGGMGIWTMVGTGAGFLLFALFSWMGIRRRQN